MNKFRNKIQVFHREFDGFIGTLVNIKKKLGHLITTNNPEYNFDVKENFTYSRQNHFPLFDLLPIYRTQNTATCDLKVYQDLFVYSYIRSNLPQGSKILEIGGGNSRIINALKGDYDCWNLDRLEGGGHGPKSLFTSNGFTLVKSNIGEFSDSLPDHYFDLIFSISVIEHFPEVEKELIDIYSDMERLLKKGGLSLHCIDALKRSDSLWVHPFVYYLETILRQFSLENIKNQILNDDELWVLPKYAYYTRWFPKTRKLMRNFGAPFSINIYWQKD